MNFIKICSYVLYVFFITFFLLDIFINKKQKKKKIFFSKFLFNLVVLLLFGSFFFFYFYNTTEVFFIFKKKNIALFLFITFYLCFLIEKKLDIFKGSKTVFLVFLLTFHSFLFFCVNNFLFFLTLIETISYLFFVFFFSKKKKNSGNLLVIYVITNTMFTLFIFLSQIVIFSLYGTLNIPILLVLKDNTILYLLQFLLVILLLKAGFFPFYFFKILIYKNLKYANLIWYIFFFLILLVSLMVALIVSFKISFFFFGIFSIFSFFYFFLNTSFSQKEFFVFSSIFFFTFIFLLF